MRMLQTAHKQNRIMQISCCLLCLWVLAACNLTANTAPTPAPTPDIPTIEFLSPPNNSQVFEGFNLLLDIVAQDAGDGVAKVEFFVDGELVNEAAPEEANSVPIFRVEMNWVAQREGLHVLEAVAYREDNTRSDPAILNIQVVLRE